VPPIHPSLRHMTTFTGMNMQNLVVPYDRDVNINHNHVINVIWAHRKYAIHSVAQHKLCATKLTQIGSGLVRNG